MLLTYAAYDLADQTSKHKEGEAILQLHEAGGNLLHSNLLNSSWPEGTATDAKTPQYVMCPHAVPWC